MQLTKTLGCECFDYPYTLLLRWHLLLCPPEKTMVCHHRVEEQSSQCETKVHAQVALLSLAAYHCRNS